jgi:hypothetical protein
MLNIIAPYAFHPKIMQDIPTHWQRESFSISVRYPSTSCFRINVGTEPKFLHQGYGKIPPLNRQLLFIVLPFGDAIM